LKSFRSKRDEELTADFENKLKNFSQNTRAYQPPNDSDFFAIKSKIRIGQIVYVRTPAGPIVEVKVTNFLDFAFEGTISDFDNDRLFNAGSVKSNPGFQSTFFFHHLVEKKDYDIDVSKDVTTNLKKKKK
jgi:hypothetical protein